MLPGVFRTSHDPGFWTQNYGLVKERIGELKELIVMEEKKLHHRVTEGTEKEKINYRQALVPLCVLCDSVVQTGVFSILRWDELKRGPEMNSGPLFYV